MNLPRRIYSAGPAGLPRWKRFLDLGFILLMLPVLLPLAALAALLIRLVSDGPILFRQERVGYLGRRFVCLKFRTMFASSQPTSHEGHLEQLMASNSPMVKLDAHGDSRIIPLGTLLRSSGLDELPQFINVLRGEMSVVGPRPCLPYESEKYHTSHKERFHAVPGLTGLWQVSGKNKTTFVEMIHFDVAYARNKSLRLDLEIILKTIPALIVQMWEMLQKRKSLSNALVSKTMIPARVVNHG